jgi:heat shock protein 1/8
MIYLCLSYICSVFDAKRLIGRKFADAEVQSDIKHFPFKVFDKGGKPYILVNYRGEDKEFVSVSCICTSHQYLRLLQSPEEISSMVLTKMRGNRRIVSWL